MSSRSLELDELAAQHHREQSERFKALCNALRAADVDEKLWRAWGSVPPSEFDGAAEQVLLALDATQRESWDVGVIFERMRWGACLGFESPTAYLLCAARLGVRFTYSGEMHTVVPLAAHEWVLENLGRASSARLVAVLRTGRVLLRGNQT